MLDQTNERLAEALSALSDVQLALDRERLRRQESDALFDLVLESMSDALLMVDRRGQIWRANASAARLAGRPAAELQGLTIDAVLGSDAPATPWEISARSHGGRAFEFEVALPRPDGISVPVSVSCAVTQDSRGKVEGAIYSARDLSETQRLAHRLAEAEARWRLLAEVGELLAGEHGVVASLPDVCGRVAASVGSGVAVALLVAGVVQIIDAPGGWHPAELGAAHGRPPERRSALWTAIGAKQIVQAASVQPGFPLVGVGGASEIRSAAVIPLRAGGRAVPGDDAARGALVVFSRESGAVRDSSIDLLNAVSLRIGAALASAELRDSLARVEARREAERMREELIASVSHDMQTPLAALLGTLVALQAPTALPEDERRTLYEVMARQASTLRRLVRQFLDYARLEAGRPLVVRVAPTDIEAVVREVVGDYAQQAAIDVRIDEPLPRALVDPDRMNQVLANVLSNAIKYSPAGAPIEVVAQADAGEIEIAVSDRGRGIPPADLARLFEKFHRGSNATGTDGTGIGLYLSRALVEAQQGRLAARSRLGKGSVFTIRVPLAAPPDADGA